MATVSIIGTGYVGLTTGACFAKLGHTVICSDIDEQKIASLQRGEIPIFEKGLDHIVNECIKNGSLSFVVGAAKAVEKSEFHYLCVPTPEGKDGSADLSYLKAAAAEIKDILPLDSVVVNKSTVPVGSTTVVSQELERPDVKVVSNPEFLREGSAVEDFLNPDRVVIGSDDQNAALRVASLYAQVSAPIMITDPLSAELIKYASNAFLASKLSFVNAISNLCEALGANVHDVVKGMGQDSRIGLSFSSPGPGWGGSCFPKDTSALIKIASDAGYEFDLLDEVVKINTDQFKRTAMKIIDSSEPGDAVAIMGLTFKAGTDDLRQSPSIEVIKLLIEAGLRVKAYDPVADSESLKRMYPDLDLEIASDPYTAAEGASVLAILTEWDEFSRLDMEKLSEVMKAGSIIDARNVVDPNLIREYGFKYRGVDS